ncbi:MAG: hypothetical protein GXN98_03975 [Euryarchaeota archaeon]|nr:hypothetical protein [Euryarchaeota archaeon]
MKLSVVLNSLSLCKCPSCGVVVPKSELEEHFARCTSGGCTEPRRIIRTKLECRCGRSFISRERIREHVKQCPALLEKPLMRCQECGGIKEVLLRSRELLCPECVLQQRGREVLGALALSTAGDAYIEAISAAAPPLLEKHGAASLEELGIGGVLVVDSATTEWSWSGSVLVFTTSATEGALRHFRLRLPGELCRAHLRQECWGWKSPAEPRSLFETRATELAERLMLTKHAIHTGASEVLEGELLAAEEMLATLPPPSREHFLTLSCEERFTEVSELSFRVAQMEHLLASGSERLKKRCLSSMRGMQRYVDAGGGAALLALFRTAFSQGRAALEERVANLIRGFDVWAKHEELGLF